MTVHSKPDPLIPASNGRQIHLVSDATGETLDNLVTAVLAQFEDASFTTHLWPMIRSSKQMQRVMEDIVAQPGLVLFTMVNDEIRKTLVTGCDKMGLPYLSVLDPLLDTIGKYLGAEATGQAGRQHELNTGYFERIDALQYTINHDDGLVAHDLSEADIVLVGVSRTSKTPTAIYLANKGFKTANVPFVPNITAPEAFDNLENCFIAGLTTSPERLIQIREARVQSLSGDNQTSYTNIEEVRREILECKRLCKRKGWPVIDVTRRSIEETAAEILRYYHQWQDRRAPDRTEAR